MVDERIWRCPLKFPTLLCKGIAIKRKNMIWGIIGLKHKCVDSCANGACTIGYDIGIVDSDFFGMWIERELRLGDIPVELNKRCKPKYGNHEKCTANDRRLPTSFFNRKNHNPSAWIY